MTSAIQVYQAWQASRCQQAFSKPCLVKVISKDTHLIFSISLQALRCQQAFSKPCLVKVISKDTHLIFSISLQALRCQQAFSKPCLVNVISKDTHLTSIPYLFDHQSHQSRHLLTFYLIHTLVNVYVDLLAFTRIAVRHRPEVVDIGVNTI